MNVRGICKTIGCQNLQRKSHSRSNGDTFYLDLCHTHSTTHLRDKGKMQAIRPEIVPSIYSRPYSIWRDMRKRCDNSKSTFYDRYGGRGITYDDRWLSFKNFWSDMGQSYSDDLTLDRIDNDGNYELSNCRWATRTEQMNNRSNAHRLTFNGKTLGISEWSRETGIKRTTIKERVTRYGWSIEKTLTTGAK